jgi:HAD superfamily 5'-nucleotidase-like hydrolase
VSTNPEPEDLAIFCNREMHGEGLEAIGFDMDFTLAQYNEEFDLLAFEGAREKLHSTLGYPPEVLDFKYSPTLFRRGLVIDKQNGNIIKVDRHRYARKVVHGLTEMSSEERKRTYVQSFSQAPTYSGKSFVNIDTLFLLVDALLFAHLVDLFDRNSHLPFFANRGTTYASLYQDVRHCVDLCHRDGIIKDAVMRDPAKYVIYDPQLVPMLQRYRASGKKTFLLTNSFWEYTDVVMKYLVQGGGSSSSIAHADVDWTDLFDVTIVGACKPAFLTKNNDIYRLEQSGKLHNIEDPDRELMLLGDGEVGSRMHRVFQGGSWQNLHQLLGVSGGENILYVGDHMYSDIAKSKRILGWRTCLIIPELEQELRVYRQEKKLMDALSHVHALQYDLDEYQDMLWQRRKSKSLGTGCEVDVEIEAAEAKASQVRAVRIALRDTLDARFNRLWGQMFKAGHRDSRFAQQVNDFACLYTSRASNLGQVAPNRPFRPEMDLMPHDSMLSAGGSADVVTVAHASGLDGATKKRGGSGTVS